MARRLAYQTSMCVRSGCDNLDPGHAHFSQPSQLTITLSATLQKLPDPETLVFGEVCLTFLMIGMTQSLQVMTDHMLYMDFVPERGWSPPQIKPYGPLSLDPACSCFQYCPSVFEGMKVCLPMFNPLTSICRTVHRHTWGPMVSLVYSDLN